METWLIDIGAEKVWIQKLFNEKGLKMLLLGWGKRRGNEWKAVRVYKKSWPIF